MKKKAITNSIQQAQVARELHFLRSFTPPRETSFDAVRLFYEWKLNIYAIRVNGGILSPVNNTPVIDN